MNELLSSQTIDDGKILKLIHKKCKNKDKILDAIHGLNMTPDQEFKLKIAKKHMDQLDMYISACEVEMIKRAYPMRNAFEHIVQIRDKEGYYSKKYVKIKKHRGHKKAIIAIARMMLIAIYHMILTGETFNPSDFDEILNPKQYNPHKQFTVESALYFLQQQGIDTSSIQINR